jgi:hypothetical protein
VAVYIVFFNINRTDLCQMIAIQPVSLALLFIHPDLNWRQQVWLLKNSFSVQTASNSVIENVYPGRENRL